MNKTDYIGKICPFCHAPIKPGAKLLVCSDCGMPHHADCWRENRGCTTYGCRGYAVPVTLDDKGKPVKENIFKRRREPEIAAREGGEKHDERDIEEYGVSWREPLVLFLKTFFRLSPVVFIFLFVLLRLTVDISVPVIYYILSIMLFGFSFLIDRIIPEK